MIYPTFRRFAGRTIALALAAALAFGAAAQAADRYEAALRQFQNHEYEIAVISLKNELQSDPGNLPALVLLGRTYLRLGNGRAAAQVLERARGAGADEALIIIALGRAYLQQDQYQRLLKEISPQGRPDKLKTEILTLHGDAYLAMGDLDKAKETFNHAIAMGGLSAGPRVGLARVALSRGRPSVAADYLSKAMFIDRDNADAWYFQGEVRRMQGSPADAVENYARALAIEPRHLSARLSRTAMLIDLNRNDEARVDLEFLNEHRGANPQIAYLDALLLSREGKMREAEAVLAETAARLDEVDAKALRNNAAVMLLAGVVANAQGKREQAREHLERFIVLEPRHPLARRLLGLILAQQGEGEAAVKMLTEALGYAPDDPAIHTALGVAYRQTGDFAQSVSAFTRAVELAPKASAVRIELARTRLAAGQINTALTDLEFVARGAGPYAADAGVLLARTHLRRRHLDAAEVAVDAAIQADPKNVPGLLIQGDVRLAKGEATLAGAAFQHALELDAGNLLARYGLAAAALRQGDTRAAAQQYEAILDQQKSELRAMIGLSSVARRENRQEEAVRWLEKARASDRTAVAPQLQLVALHLSNSDTARAMDAAERLVDAAPTSIDALDALARVQAADGKAEAARQTYRQAALLPGVTAQRLTAIAFAQLGIRDVEGARSTLKTTLDRNPGFLPAETAMVAADTADKAFGAARTRAEQLQADYPNKALGPELLGDVMMAMGRYEQAINAYSLAMERERSARRAVKLSQAQSNAGQTQAGLKGLEDWRSEHPDDDVVQRPIAAAYMASGKLAEAQAIYEQLLAKNPDDSRILNDLAWLYQKRGDPKALPTAEKAYELDPSDAGTLDTYGWVLVESGQPERGLKILRKAETRASEHPWIRYHIALALSRLNRDGEARDLLEKLLRSSAGFSGEAEAKSLLARLSGG